MKHTGDVAPPALRPRWRDGRPRWQRFAVARDGARDNENEDAAAVSPDGRSAAVADGATESSFAGLWAALLVEAFVSAPLQWLDSRRQRQTAALEWIRRQWHGAVPWGELPWFAAEKAEQGAFAAFAGVHLHPLRAGQWRWRCLAVGDSCLTVWSPTGLLRSFPLAETAAFAAAPVLVPSRPRPQTSCRFHRAWGTAKPGMGLALASDALSRWMLERPRAAAAMLCRWWHGGQAAFAADVTYLRQEAGLRNDDTTLLLMRLA